MPSRRATTSESQSGVVRALCRDLLGQIPDEGLAELFEAMEAIREFYAPPTAPLVGEPASTRMHAKPGKTYRRPDFHIEEE